MKIIQDAAGKTIFAGYALPSPCPVGTVLDVADNDPRGVVAQPIQIAPPSLTQQILADPSQLAELKTALGL